MRIEYKYCPNLSVVDTPGLLVPKPAATEAATEDTVTGAATTTAISSPFAEAQASDASAADATARRWPCVLGVARLRGK